MKSKFKKYFNLNRNRTYRGIFGFISSRNSLGLLIYNFIVDLDKALYRNGFNVLVISMLSLITVSWVLYFFRKGASKEFS